SPQLRGIHLDPVLGGVDGTGLAIDVNLDIGSFRIVLAGRSRERRLNPVEQDILGDILVAVNTVHDPDQINAHSIPPRRALTCSMLTCRVAVRPMQKDPKTTPSRARSSRRGSVFLPRCHRAEQRLLDPSPAETAARPDRAQGPNQTPSQPGPIKQTGNPS